MSAGWPRGHMQEQAAAQANVAASRLAILTEQVVPAGGVYLPVRWEGLGQKMVKAGVIDQDAFESLYAQNGGLDTYEVQLLSGSGSPALRIDSQNAGVLLNLLWALGLGNTSTILEEGPMVDPQYGGAERFASTGGWTLADGEVMDHYSAHPLIDLTPSQEKLVERVAKNIYRPCCDNSTYFPDCNHGMAMLGLLQLMASQDISEDEMYAYALQVNSYWFPDTYLTISKYLQTQGIAWSEVDAREILGLDYSSASGYSKIVSQVEPARGLGGGGCAV